MLDPRELGLRIKIARLTKGMSQYDLAKVIDSTQTVISNLETGKRDLRVEELTKICQALDLQIEELCAPSEGISKVPEVLGENTTVYARHPEKIKDPEEVIKMMRELLDEWERTQSDESGAGAGGDKTPD